jgi:MoxR-like ATPase
MPEQRFKPVHDDLDTGFRYIPNRGLVDAVNMTLVLHRPLLVKGPPGCGKTRLARAIADQLHLPIYNWYVKSTSRAQDGLYSIDVVRRLQDAHLGKEKAQSLIPYLRFGALGQAIRSGQECVVLIDEIDKADIDFPNDLLRELDLMEFTIEELDSAALTEDEKRQGHRREYKAAVPPIVIVTSNDEKELPDAFLRRCLFYYIDFPEPHQLEQIVRANLDGGHVDASLISNAGHLLRRFRSLKELRKLPATSELIDWVRILLSWGIAAEALQPDMKLGEAPFWQVLFKYREDQRRVEDESAATTL